MEPAGQRQGEIGTHQGPARRRDAEEIAPKAPPQRGFVAMMGIPAWLRGALHDLNESAAPTPWPAPRPAPHWREHRRQLLLGDRGHRTRPVSGICGVHDRQRGLPQNKPATRSYCVLRAARALPEEARMSLVARCHAPQCPAAAPPRPQQDGGRPRAADRGTAGGAQHAAAGRQSDRRAAAGSVAGV